MIDKIVRKDEKGIPYKVSSSSLVPDWLIQNNLSDIIIPLICNGRDKNSKKNLEFPYGHNIFSVENLPLCNTVAIKTGDGIVVIDIDIKTDINRK